MLCNFANGLATIFDNFKISFTPFYLSNHVRLLD